MKEKGTANIDECWKHIDNLLARDWESDTGKRLRIRRIAIDSGYNTSTVYQYCSKKPSGRVYAIKGLDTLDVPVGTPKRVYVRQSGKRSRGLLLWGLGVSLIKSDLYGRLALDVPTESEINDTGYPSQFVHFPQLSEEYFQQLTGEICTLTTDPHGRPKYSWRRIYPAVETLDCLVYAIAMAQVGGQP